VKSISLDHPLVLHWKHAPPNLYPDQSKIPLIISCIDQIHCYQSQSHKSSPNNYLHKKPTPSSPHQKLKELVPSLLLYWLCCYVLFQLDQRRWMGSRTNLTEFDWLLFIFAFWRPTCRPDSPLRLLPLSTRSSSSPHHPLLVRISLYPSSSTSSSMSSSSDLSPAKSVKSDTKSEPYPVGQTRKFSSTTSPIVLNPSLLPTGSYQLTLKLHASTSKIPIKAPRTPRRRNPRLAYMCRGWSLRNRFQSTRLTRISMKRSGWKNYMARMSASLIRLKKFRRDGFLFLVHTPPVKAQLMPRS